MPNEDKLDLIVDTIKDLKEDIKTVQKDITYLKVEVKEMQVRQSWINGLYGAIGGGVIGLTGLAFYLLKTIPA